MNISSGGLTRCGVHGDGDGARFHLTRARRRRVAPTVWLCLQQLPERPDKLRVLSRKRVSICTSSLADGMHRLPHQRHLSTSCHAPIASVAYISSGFISASEPAWETYRPPALDPKAPAISAREGTRPGTAKSSTASSSVSAESGYHRCALFCCQSRPLVRSSWGQGRGQTNLYRIFHGGRVEGLAYEAQQGDGEENDGPVLLADASAVVSAFFCGRVYISVVSKRRCTVRLPVASKNASWETMTTSAAETARKMYTLARRRVAAVLRVFSLLELDML